MYISCVLATNALHDAAFEYLSSSIYAQQDSHVTAWGDLPTSSRPAFVESLPSRAVSGQPDDWRGLIVVGFDDQQLFAAAVQPSNSGADSQLLSPAPQDWQLQLQWSRIDIGPMQIGVGCKSDAAASSDGTVAIASACSNSGSSQQGSVLAQSSCTVKYSGRSVVATCSFVGKHEIGSGNVQDAQIDPANSGVVWIASSDGLWMAGSSSAGPSRVVGGYGFNAVACSPLQEGPTQQMVAAGGVDRMYYVRSGTNETGASPAPTVLGFEWVSVVSTGTGGVYDNEVTALGFVPPFDRSLSACSGDGEADEFAGALVVGTKSVLNVRWANGTVVRVPGWAGLPMGNITSVAAQRGLDAAGQCSTRIAAGTTTGLALASPGSSPGGEAAAGREYDSADSTSVETGPDGALGSPGGVGRPAGSWPWKWLRHGRWLPSDGVSGLAIGQGVDQGGMYVAVTTSYLSSEYYYEQGASPVTFGVAVVDPQRWTLAEKATRTWNINDARHNRHGMVGESDLPSFGDLSGAVQGPSDNQGLWTSVVLAGALWQTVLGQSDVPNEHTLMTPVERVERYFSGMELLNNVTGIKGLMARSCLDPSTPPPAGDSAWHNSTSMPGWTWKGTTSSDEVVGHTFAFAAVSAAARAAEGLSPERQIPAHVRTRAAELLRNTAVYIVSNNFTLKDFDGKPTRWGHWNPEYINDNRTWSDNRGVSSLEAAALLANAYDAALELNDTTGAAVILSGWKKLFVPVSEGGAGYGSNIVNLKIEAPSDDNYSDDELTFLPFYAYLHSKSLTKLGAAVTGDGDLPTPESLTLMGLRRTWDFVAPTRPDLWAAIFSSVALDGTCTKAQPGSQRPYPGGGCTIPPAGVDASEMSFLARSAASNLRQWPLDPLQWPVQNSDRLDIWLDPEENRDARHGTESMGVLPADERCYGRWNGNPHDLDGCNGYTEMDGGVFIAPYWLARAHGLIDAPAT